ncbi:MAG: hypothetical protein ACYTFA_19425, partial [Planctomycetota bacterium]
DPDAPVSTECDSDGDLCTGDHCDANGACVPHAPYDVTCTRIDQCTDSACNPTTGACDPVPDPLSTFCETDNDLCTTQHCDGAGACVILDNVVCDDHDPCTDDSCNPSTGQCVYTPNFVCGDGTCDPVCEDCNTCRQDCNTCGDGCCSAGEDGCTCPADCPGPCCGDDIREGAEVCDGTDDDACPGECDARCRCPSDTPAVSNWGMAILLLVLLVGITIKLGAPRRATGR